MDEEHREILIGVCATVGAVLTLIGNVYNLFAENDEATIGYILFVIVVSVAGGGCMGGLFGWVLSYYKEIASFVIVVFAIILGLWGIFWFLTRVVPV